MLISVLVFVYGSVSTASIEGFATPVSIHRNLIDLLRPITRSSSNDSDVNSTSPVETNATTMPLTVPIFQTPSPSPSPSSNDSSNSTIWPQTPPSPSPSTSPSTTQTSTEPVTEFKPMNPNPYPGYFPSTPNSTARPPPVTLYIPTTPYINSTPPATPSASIMTPSPTLEYSLATTQNRSYFSVLATIFLAIFGSLTLFIFTQ